MTVAPEARSAPVPALLDVCPSCGFGPGELVYEQDEVPIHSCRLVATLDEARSFPRGRLRLAFCRGCGFLWNAAYDPSVQDYGISYEETQGFSPRFRAFAEELAEQWVERYDLNGKDVLEIGSGKGEFLALLCELGGNRGVGIDPAFVEERLASPAADRMRFVKDLYGERYADVEADAIVCRHTLEHIGPVGEFMRLVRRTASHRAGAVALFELPDVGRVLREGAFWDVYYEHCSYFSPGSLARLFRASGFEITELSLAYDGQYILVAGRPVEAPAVERHPLEEDVDELARDVERFRTSLAETASRWRDRISAERAAGRRTVIWGAGSKGVAFLVTLGVGEGIAAAVDINPFKQGMFLAGTGHEVSAPDDLPGAPPDLVVVMNAIYVDEVRAQLHTLGLSPEVVAV